MIAGVALDIAAEGEGWRQRASNLPELERRPPRRAYASNADSLAFIGKQAARSVAASNTGARPKVRLVHCDSTPVHIVLRQHRPFPQR
jgi:hypothetical protein